MDGDRFVPLEQVAGADNSVTTHQYMYTDVEAPAGTCYYRLQLIDHDGSTAYSPVRMVLSEEGQLLYPNPAPGGTTILANAAPGTAVRVRDSLGRMVLTATADPAGKAALAGLPAGLYQVQTSTNNARLSVQ